MSDEVMAKKKNQTIFLYKSVHKLYQYSPLLHLMLQLFILVIYFHLLSAGFFFRYVLCGGQILA